MKANVSQIVDAYSKCVMSCMEKIKQVNELHESEEARAFHTKKVIDKWFRMGGIIK